MVITSLRTDGSIQLNVSGAEAAMLLTLTVERQLSLEQLVSLLVTNAIVATSNTGALRKLRLVGAAEKCSADANVKRKRSSPMVLAYTSMLNLLLMFREYQESDDRIEQCIGVLLAHLREQLTTSEIRELDEAIK